MKKRVGIAMSGGVDSSLVAFLLKDMGYDIFGITMKHLYEDEKLDRPCCSLEDILDAKKICDKLDIPHYTINLKDIFKEKIIDYFINEYEKGNTPNPCVMCNREIKLGTILKYVYKLGGNSLATGHYAKQIDNKLYVSEDVFKDQTYFLSQVRKEDLSNIMFPLGDMNKERVRVLASEYGIITRDKLDSQGICFIKKDYKEFLDKNANPIYKGFGNIVDINGNILGSHNGIYNYTIGQRQGLGISDSRALYVIEIRPKTKEVVVGYAENLFSNTLKCNRINILVDNLEEYIGSKVYVKARARDIKNFGILESFDNNSLKIHFENGVRAITKGQIAAIYHLDDWVICSGIIE
jgi:tRNA-specific 2-thiouridylase